MKALSNHASEISIESFIENKPFLKFHLKEPVSKVVEKMQEHHIYAGLVIDQGSLAGLLTEHAILVYLLNWLASPDHRTEKLCHAFNLLRAEDVMIRHPVTVGADAGMEDVMEIFDSNGFRYLPVVKKGVPIGVISRFEIAQEIDEKNRKELETKDSILSYLMNHENYGCL